jgi:hypothetical protein
MNVDDDLIEKDDTERGNGKKNTVVSNIPTDGMANTGYRPCVLPER